MEVCCGIFFDAILGSPASEAGSSRYLSGGRSCSCRSRSTQAGQRSWQARHAEGISKLEGTRTHTLRRLGKEGYSVRFLTTSSEGRPERSELSELQGALYRCGIPVRLRSFISRTLSNPEGTGPSVRLSCFDEPPGVQFQNVDDCGQSQLLRLHDRLIEAV